MNPTPCFPLVFDEKSSRRPSLFQCSFLHSISAIWAFLLLGWPKILFGLFHNILWENLNELFGQPNTLQKTRLRLASGISYLLCLFLASLILWALQLWLQLSCYKMWDFGKLVVGCVNVFGEAQTTLHVNASAPTPQQETSSLKSVLNYSKSLGQREPSSGWNPCKAGAALFGLTFFSWPNILVPSNPCAIVFWKANSVSAL